MNDKVKRFVILKDGEELKAKGSRSKGSLAETDIYSYEIVDQSGAVVGATEHTHHTEIKGFKVTQTFKQWDAEGNIILEERW